MQEITVPITFSGRIRLKSLIVIRQEMPFERNLFDMVRGKWQLPESQSPMIMRPEVMQDIETNIGQDAGSNFTRILRLCGERGVGKTHLAMQFAHTHYEKSRFQSIVWLNISDNNQDSLESQWAYLCVGLGVELTEKSSLADMTRLAYQKIISYGEALFIFDGVEDYLSIEPYLKFNNSAITLLITSRNGIAWGYNDHHYELQPFTEDQAVTWLEQWQQRHNTPSNLEQNRKLVRNVHCHPLRLQELATLMTYQAAASASTQSVKFQSNVDINTIVQDEFAFRFLSYCALLCPYQEVELDFFYSLIGDTMHYEVSEAIYLLKQHGLIGYPPTSSRFYTPSILADIALRDLKNNEKIKMITELLQVSLKILSPNNAHSMINHLSQLVEHIVDILSTEHKKSPSVRAFFQNNKPSLLLQVLNDSPQILIKFVDLYNQTLIRNNLDNLPELRNTIQGIKKSFNESLTLEHKCMQ
jgi:hypothetical protein